MSIFNVEERDIAARDACLVLLLVFLLLVLLGIASLVLFLVVCGAHVDF